MLERSDWQYKTMKDICYVNQGFQINIEKRDKHKRKNNKIYITIQHLNGVGDDEYINDKDHNDSVVCNPDDVLMTRTGNTGRVVTGVSGVFHNNFFRINFDKLKINKGYLVYYLNLKNIQNLILEKAGTSTIPDLNHGDFYSIPFNYPENINEQIAISKTLSNIDNLINSLETLILKKQNIKHGVMNYMFGSNSMHKEELRNLTSMFSGGTPSTTNSDYYRHGNIKWLSISDMTNSGKYTNDTIVKITNVGLSNSSAKLFKKGTLFFAMYASIGKITIATDDMSCSQAILGFGCENIDRDYLYHYLKYINDKIKNMGQTGTQSNLSKTIVEKIQIDIPNDKLLERKISSILNNFDNEIESLKAKLLKYKKIKEGMMEDLLTGKVRLNYE